MAIGKSDAKTVEARPGAKGDPELKITTLKAGDATHFPPPGSTCRIHYEGRLPEGTVFDSTRRRQRPLCFKLGSDQLITGLDVGISKMSCGQICVFDIHPNLAYGSAGYLPIIPPDCTLTFEVELINFYVEPEVAMVTMA
ncbi:hypothetical protein M885DRAFT_509928 [Pelagophyceae sp. CCMP2097]|nr:hypothetical protein M885DRAFT_509928 [Pelagophyceae sp. CCMP2097]|mmetsp:Transcript_13159/g.43949  ORF Transcript_13159/g.43949 Transcript_13159/m.43949 type:complete len:140 (-) Transcript_13159:250-669(-)